MDFHSMKRKVLQALCKKHNLRANLTNLEMADNLASIFKEGGSCEEEISGGNSKKGVDNVKAAQKLPKKVTFCTSGDTIYEFVDLDSDSNWEKGNNRRKSLRGKPQGPKAEAEVQEMGPTENVRVMMFQATKSMDAEVPAVQSPVVLKKKRGIKAVETESAENVLERGYGAGKSMAVEVSDVQSPVVTKKGKKGKGIEETGPAENVRETRSRPGKSMDVEAFSVQAPIVAKKVKKGLRSRNKNSFCDNNKSSPKSDPGFKNNGHNTRSLRSKEVSTTNIDPQFEIPHRFEIQEFKKLNEEKKVAEDVGTEKNLMKTRSEKRNESVEEVEICEEGSDKGMAVRRSKRNNTSTIEVLALENEREQGQTLGKRSRKKILKYQTSLIESQTIGDGVNAFEVELQSRSKHIPMKGKFVGHAGIDEMGGRKQSDKLSSNEILEKKSSVLESGTVERGERNYQEEEPPRRSKRNASKGDCLSPTSEKIDTDKISQKETQKPSKKRVAEKMTSTETVSKEAVTISQVNEPVRRQSRRNTCTSWEIVGKNRRLERTGASKGDCLSPTSEKIDTDKINQKETQKSSKKRVAEEMTSTETVSKVAVTISQVNEPVRRQSRRNTCTSWEIVGKNRRLERPSDYVLEDNSAGSNSKAEDGSKRSKFLNSQNPQRRKQKKVGDEGEEDMTQLEGFLEVSETKDTESVVADEFVDHPLLYGEHADAFDKSGIARETKCLDLILEGNVSYYKTEEIQEQEIEVTLTQESVDSKVDMIHASGLSTAHQANDRGFLEVSEAKDLKEFGVAGGFDDTACEENVDVPEMCVLVQTSSMECGNLHLNELSSGLDEDFTSEKTISITSTVVEEHSNSNPDFDGGNLRVSREKMLNEMKTARVCVEDVKEAAKGGWGLDSVVGFNEGFSSDEIAQQDGSYSGGKIENSAATSPLKISGPFELEGNADISMCSFDLAVSVLSPVDAPKCQDSTTEDEKDHQKTGSVKYKQGFLEVSEAKEPTESVVADEFEDQQLMFGELEGNADSMCSFELAISALSPVDAPKCQDSTTEDEKDHQRTGSVKYTQGFLEVSKTKDQIESAVAGGFDYPACEENANVPKKSVLVQTSLKEHVDGNLVSNELSSGLGEEFISKKAIVDEELLNSFTGFLEVSETKDLLESAVAGGFDYPACEEKANVPKKSVLVQTGLKECVNENLVSNELSSGPEEFTSKKAISTTTTVVEEDRLTSYTNCDGGNLWDTRENKLNEMEKANVCPEEVKKAAEMGWGLDSVVGLNGNISCEEIVQQNESCCGDKIENSAATLPLKVNEPLELEGTVDMSTGPFGLAISAPSAVDALKCLDSATEVEEDLPYEKISSSKCRQDSPKRNEKVFSGKKIVSTERYKKELDCEEDQDSARGNRCGYKKANFSSKQNVGENGGSPELGAQQEEDLEHQESSSIQEEFEEDLNSATANEVIPKQLDFEQFLGCDESLQVEVDVMGSKVVDYKDWEHVQEVKESRPMKVGSLTVLDSTTANEVIPIEYDPEGPEQSQENLVAALTDVAVRDESAQEEVKIVDLDVAEDKEKVKMTMEGNPDCEHEEEEEEEIGTVDYDQVHPQESLDVAEDKEKVKMTMEGNPDCEHEEEEEEEIGTVDYDRVHPQESLDEEVCYESAQDEVEIADSAVFEDKEHVKMSMERNSACEPQEELEEEKRSVKTKEKTFDAEECGASKYFELQATDEISGDIPALVPSSTSAVGELRHGRVADKNPEQVHTATWTHEFSCREETDSIDVDNQNLVMVQDVEVTYKDLEEPNQMSPCRSDVDEVIYKDLEEEFELEVGTEITHRGGDSHKEFNNEKVSVVYGSVDSLSKEFPFEDKLFTIEKGDDEAMVRKFCDHEGTQNYEMETVNALVLKEHHCEDHEELLEMEQDGMTVDGKFISQETETTKSLKDSSVLEYVEDDTNVEAVSMQPDEEGLCLEEVESSGDKNMKSVHLIMKEESLNLHGEKMSEAAAEITGAMHYKSKIDCENKNIEDDEHLEIGEVNEIDGDVCAFGPTCCTPTVLCQSSDVLYKGKSPCLLIGLIEGDEEKEIKACEFGSKDASSTEVDNGGLEKLQDVQRGHENEFSNNTNSCGPQLVQEVRNEGLKNDIEGEVEKEVVAPMGRESLGIVKFVSIEETMKMETLRASLAQEELDCDKNNEDAGVTGRVETSSIEFHNKGSSVEKLTGSTQTSEENEIFMTSKIDLVSKQNLEVIELSRLAPNEFRYEDCHVVVENNSSVEATSGETVEGNVGTKKGMFSSHDTKIILEQIKNNYSLQNFEIETISPVSLGEHDCEDYRRALELSNSIEAVSNELHCKVNEFWDEKGNMRAMEKVFNSGSSRDVREEGNTLISMAELVCEDGNTTAEVEPVCLSALHVRSDDEDHNETVEVNEDSQAISHELDSADGTALEENLVDATVERNSGCDDQKIGNAQHSGLEFECNVRGVSTNSSAQKDYEASIIKGSEHSSYEQALSVDAHEEKNGSSEICIDGTDAEELDRDGQEDDLWSSLSILFATEETENHERRIESNVENTLDAPMEQISTLFDKMLISSKFAGKKASPVQSRPLTVIETLKHQPLIDEMKENTPRIKKQQFNNHVDKSVTPFHRKRRALENLHNFRK